MGSVEASGRACQARLQDRQVDRCQVHDSPSGATFSRLEDVLSDIAACDFFTVPTVTFRVLFCFVILSHDRLKVLHFSVTANPTTPWAAQQLVEAFPFDSAPRYLLHDNDSNNGEVFRKRVANLGIEEVRTAYRSPWQNPYVERLIGSARWECLDHVIVLGESHLRRILGEYFAYYNDAQTHMGLDADVPGGRAVEPPECGGVIAIPQVGGLHHRYSRRAA